MKTNTSDHQSEKLTHTKYRADIDGLRAVAVLSVVFFHAFPAWFKGGFVGVDIFFVISGFLISTIIFENLVRNSFSFLEFYIRRIRRIFPALLVVLIACLIFGWFALFSDEYKQLGKHIAAAAAFVSNLVLWSENGYFDNAGETKPLLHLWSLGIEEQFYIFWPAILWFMWKKRFNLLTITIVIAALSFVHNIFEIQRDAIETFYNPLTRFWEMFAGALLAWFTLQQKANAVGHKSNHWFNSNVQAWLGAILIVVAIMFITKESQFPGWWALLPTLGTVLMISAGTQAWLNRTILSNKLLVWVGLISFPLYLWHWPLLSFARIVESEVPARNIRIAVVIFSILLAWLTYKFIETPIRFGSNAKAKTLSLLGLMIIVGGFGYYVYQQDGLKFRDPTGSEAYIAQTIEQQFSDKCSLEFKKISHCAEKIQSGKSIILLIGDSHVRHTYELIKDQVVNVGYDIIGFSNGGCPFLIDLNTENVNDCVDKNNEVLDFIKDNRSSIKAIIMVGEFTKYIEPGWLISIGGKSKVSLEDALRKTVEKLQDFPIVMFEQVPLITFEPKKCLRRPFRISSNSFACQTSYDTAMSLLQVSRSTIRKAVERFSNVALFNVDSSLCDGETCKVILNGRIIYYDKTHLNPIGVAYVRSQINFAAFISEIIVSNK